MIFLYLRMPRSLFLLFLLISFIGRAQPGYVDSLEGLYKAAKHDTTRGRLMILLSEAVYEENYDTIIPLCQKAIALANNHLKTAKGTERIAYLKIKSAGYNNIGYITNEQGDIQKALEYYMKAMEVDLEINDQEGISVSLNNIATIYNAQGDIPRALEYHLRGLKIKESINDKSGMSYSLHNIGHIYEELGDTARARNYYLRSHALKEELHDSGGIANSLNSLGGLYDDGNAEKALYYYNRALQIGSLLNNKMTLGNVLNNIGAVYNRLGMHEKAMEYYDKSLHFREEIKDKEGTAFTLFNIGLAKIDLGKTAEAQTSFERSLKLAQELGYPEYIRNASGELALIYSKGGRWKEAFEMEKLFKLMSDSITNVSVTKNLLQKSFQYEYGKKAAADSVKAGEEKKVYEARASKERTQRFALIGGLILVIGFAVFMVNRLRLIQRQKDIIEEKNKEILDSIYYARKIQNSLLTNEKYIARAIERLRKINDVISE